MSRSVVFIAAFLAGCGGGGLADRRGGEIEWLERYGAWSAQFGDEVSAAAPDALAPAELSRCTRSFARRVGPAPDRFRSVERRVRRACRHYERAASLAAEITPGRDPGPLLYPIQVALARGETTFAQATYELERRLQVSRPLPVSGVWTDDSHVNRRFGRAAEAVANVPVEVRCWSDDDWDVLNDEYAALGGEREAAYAGVVGADADRVHLAPEVCEPLAELVYEESWRDDPEPGYDETFAVLALAHEATHLFLRSATEAEVECRAIQQVRPAARALGIGGEYADAMAELAWEEIYPDNEPEYRTPACYDGGPFDLDRRSARWP